MAVQWNIDHFIECINAAAEDKVSSRHFGITTDDEVYYTSFLRGMKILEGIQKNKFICWLLRRLFL